MPRVELQPAYVLHARAYRETSQLLEAYSRDYGRLGIVARGSRSARSRLRNVLQPFRPLLLSWTRKGDLATLTGAEQVAAPPLLAGEALYCGIYMNELLMRFVHRHDPHPEVFERYRTTLARLALGGNVQPGLRVFEKHLLDAIGFGLVLDREFPDGAALRAEALYEYRPDQGPVRVGEGARGRRGVVTGNALQSLVAEDIEDRDLPELRHMMRRIIRHHLGDKPLASDSLFYRARGAANILDEA